MEEYDWLCTISGMSCANCEDSPAADDDLFCSDDCRDEYEGVGKYAEEDES